MEKRIRNIWMLSLASVLLLLGVQGNLLYNQYQHEVNAYARELAEKILKAGEEELEIRKKNAENSATNIRLYDEINSDSLGEKSSLERMSLYIYNTKEDELKVGYRTSDNPIERSEILLKRIKTYSSSDDDSLKLHKNPIWKATDDNGVFFVNDSSTNTNLKVVTLNLSINPNISNENKHKGIDQAIINYKNPFCKESLDSILMADIPEINYTMTHINPQDSVGVSSSWYLAGSLFSPYMKVLYLYSPFEGKGVEIIAAIPAPPVFKRMAVQLLLSLVLILLLIGCLILQIRTILKQKKINEMREDFVHAMIHELKRPVQTLKTFISFLRNKDMRSDEMITEQVLQDSMFELDNLSAYLKKLKDMVGADNNATSLQISRFNLQELIDKIIRLVNHPPEKDVKISVRYEMESVLIDADTVHVANVVNNLIENAIKYSEQQVDIEIKAVLEERKLCLTVSDNGIGIPHSEQEKVFAKFYRGSNFPDKNIPGIGLGLSYVKLITEAHKGEVSLFSDIGKGTSVMICIPQ